MSGTVPVGHQELFVAADAPVSQVTADSLLPFIHILLQQLHFHIQHGQEQEKETVHRVSSQGFQLKPCLFVQYVVSPVQKRVGEAYFLS